jgi:hypothetical protein
MGIPDWLLKKALKMAAELGLPLDEAIKRVASDHGSRSRRLMLNPPAQIRDELKRHGVETKLLDEALHGPSSGDLEQDIAQAVLRKRLPNPDKGPTLDYSRDTFSPEMIQPTFDFTKKSGYISGFLAGFFRR